MEQPTKQQTAMQSLITITLTLAEINGVIQAMSKAPFELSNPLIAKVREQAQAQVDQMAAQMQPAQPALNQNPSLPVPQIMNPGGNG